MPATAPTLLWRLLPVAVFVALVQQTVLPRDPIFTQGPSWKAEVRAWRANPAQRLAVWPAWWSFHLASFA